MLRVYLETSFVSACVTTKEDEASLYQRWQSLTWWCRRRDRHDAFVSAEVWAELSVSGFVARERALALVKDVPWLSITNEVEGLAEELIQARLMPRRMTGDALHAALAICHAVDVVLTWDRRHLANPNKRWRLEAFCRSRGRRSPRFNAPDCWPELDP